MTGPTTYTNAIVTLRPSQLQKLESLGLYYNSPEPAIICIECGFAINPTRAPRHPGDKHHIPKAARRGLKHLIYSLNLPNPETLPLRSDGSPPHPYLTIQKGSACKYCDLRSVSEKRLLAHSKTNHFVAGLCYVDGKASPFFDLIEEEPLDVLGPTHQR
ncbi:hypothetical protein FOQG_16313 [Fusarium oxysporum f. sp. raphani 54005]|uniref:C2H2-type domain-containing protein n=2 Tax=Fusarium oxysporum f. sp. raphani TaxID=96318 RepID=X0BA51_FUSOX|nr:hypothetical protein FOQG_16313 [Fusarium oxysporum f. sp. raphani 54005]KAG7403067.1 hypothetical protein Forpi1262_v018852 [Fusarium oxysporum f. sp. raphani]